jgi:predicted anti-sigma-YlaC factor YlaD
MNKQCEIVQDLLPHFVKRTLKEQSSQYVKEHLNECEQCQAFYKELISQKEQDDKLEHAMSSSQLGETEFVLKMRKWKRKTAVVGALLILLFSVISWLVGKSFYEDTPQPVNKPAPVVEE